MPRTYPLGFLLLILACGCKQKAPEASAAKSEGEPISQPSSVFPRELYSFAADPDRPLFEGTGKDTWDRTIRERGFIVRDERAWHFFYTGYNFEQADRTRDPLRRLGHVMSQDGVDWSGPREKLATEPADVWIEDLFIYRYGKRYYMLAEGQDDVGHLLTSEDLVHWRDDQTTDVRDRTGFKPEHVKPNMIDIRTKAGAPIEPPYGTMAFWIECNARENVDEWFLLYEKNDLGVWLAKGGPASADGVHRTWTNVQDEPVIALGAPGSYDDYEIATNQVVRYKGRYYVYYHALSNADHLSTDPERRKNWTMNLAASDDLLHWQKFEGNPFLVGNRSSGFIVNDDDGGFHFYTAHPDLRRYRPTERPTAVVETTGACRR